MFVNINHSFCSCSDHEDDNESLSLITEGQIVFDASDNEECESTKSESDDDNEPSDRPSQLNKPQAAASSQSVVDEEKCIAFSSCLEQLAQTTVPSTCPKRGCCKQITTNTMQKGTSVWIFWVSKLKLHYIFN